MSLLLEAVLVQAIPLPVVAALVVAVPMYLEIVLLVLEHLVKEWLADMVEVTTILGLLAAAVVVLVLLVQAQQTLPAVMEVMV
jgi:hypothetical protein